VFHEVEPSLFLVQPRLDTSPALLLAVSG
jgi:hypothetical protein